MENPKGKELARRSSLPKSCMFFLVVCLLLSAAIPSIARAEANDRIHQIERFIQEQHDLSKIPGLSVVIVEKGKTVYQKGFGYADVKTKSEVTPDTLFEIGSTTKAFTALAILQLEQKGQLKRTDDVRTYIPWLELKYNGEPQTITIDQLMHHTSGIASNTIVKIPASKADNALELTVRTLVDQPLNRKPGSSFEYATINYDVLGYVIERVTKQPFDMYIKQHVLDPIGMKDSYVGLHQLQSEVIATGYKLGFMKEQAYTAPVYRGNIPAGYIISNSNDIAKWLHLQLGHISTSEMDQHLIQKSHEPDLSVEPFDQNTHYAAGWGVEHGSGQTYLLHAGENPTFSSYFILKPDEQVGVAILANMKTSYTTAIGQGVMDIWEGREVAYRHADSYQQLDQILTYILAAIAAIGVLLLFLSVRVISMTIRKQRIYRPFNLKRALWINLHTLFVTIVILLLIKAPKMLLGGVTWGFIKVWAPTSVTALFYSILALSAIYYIYILLLVLTRKSK